MTCIAKFRVLLLPFLVVIPCAIHAQPVASVVDGLSYGVVLDHPHVKDVKGQIDVPYYQEGSAALHMDVYSPPGLKAGEKRPAIIFLNAVGDNIGERKVKSWAIYTSWPKLMAAHGYIGISMETNRADVVGSIKRLFEFIQREGIAHHVDKDKLGIYAASANVSRAASYLMSAESHPGIKAAVLYYGMVPDGPYRKDLPVYYVVAESDARRTNYAGLWSTVLQNNAPWTIKMASGMPHAFDAFKDNDASRIILKETISFWQNYLDPVPQPSWKPSPGREILSLLYSDPPKAIAPLKKLTEENPKDTRALFTYAELLSREKRYDESREAFEKLLKNDPGHVDALIQRASLSYTTNNPSEAQEYIDRAINTGKMTGNSYAQLGFSLLIANRNDDAAKYYEKAVAMQQRGIDYYNLACAYAKNNHTEKALKALEKAVNLGYGPRQHIDQDPDLNSIRSDERYKSIVSKVK